MHGRIHIARRRNNYSDDSFSLKRCERRYRRSYKTWGNIHDRIYTRRSEVLINPPCTAAIHLSFDRRTSDEEHERLTSQKSYVTVQGYRAKKGELSVFGKRERSLWVGVRNDWTFGKGHIWRRAPVWHITVPKDTYHILHQEFNERRHK